LLHDVVLTTDITEFEFDMLSKPGPMSTDANHHCVLEFEQNGTEHHKIIVLV